MEWKNSIICVILVIVGIALTLGVISLLSGCEVQNPVQETQGQRTVEVDTDGNRTTVTVTEPEEKDDDKQ